jgi:acyl-CoA reductase-like NAD-dependent aldehyde dehydrogenase
MVGISAKHVVGTVLLEPFDEQALIKPRAVSAQTSLNTGSRIAARPPPLEYAAAAMTEPSSHAPPPSSASGPSPFAMRSPADESPLSNVVATAASAVPARVAVARAAQAGWADKSLAERARVLESVRDRALDRAESIARRVHLETGKPEIEVLLAEVLPTADVVGYWTQSIEELLDAVEVQLDKLTFPGKTALIHREPRGVIGLITPWNYPVAIPLRTLVPALLAGNAVVFKPSEISPRSGAIVGELFEGLLPPGVLEVVQGGGDVGAALASADVDLVVFTGSVATGRKVAHACAERVSPCALELGGKDAAIVLADANLPRAVNGVVWGALTNAGQNCASIERVYVEQSIAQAFTDQVVAAVKALKLPDEVGPLTTAAQRATVADHVDAAKRAGAKVLAGDEQSGKGTAFAPAVLSVSGDDTPLMKEETFGPVIPIAVVANVEEAIARANASRFGLTASIWTKDVQRAEQIAHKLRAGVVTINNHAFTGALPGAPWSGVGDTGYGITNSPLALEGLTRPRLVLVDRNRAQRELWWYPYTPVLRTIALSMAVLRSHTSGFFKKIASLFRLLGAFPKRLMGG